MQIMLALRTTQYTFEAIFWARFEFSHRLERGRNLAGSLGFEPTRKWRCHPQPPPFFKNELAFYFQAFNSVSAKSGALNFCSACIAQPASNSRLSVNNPTILSPLTTTSLLTRFLCIISSASSIVLS
jgi:hypothetical protein